MWQLAVVVEEIYIPTIKKGVFCFAKKIIMVPPKWPNVLEVFVYSSTKSAGNGRAVDTAPA